MSTIHVDVVSAEELIFSGEATFVALPGEAGELGIYPRHTPLISRFAGRQENRSIRPGRMPYCILAPFSIASSMVPTI